MRIVELVLDEDQDFTGIDAISIVTHPAIEANGVYLKKQEPVLMAKETEKKGIFIAPVLKPNKMIYREDASGEPYYVRFAKETVAICLQKYMEEMRQHNTTEQHENDVDDVFMFEAWIVEDVKIDKSALYGLDTNVGTWVAMFKINNEDTRAKLESGELKGISIEGYFADKLEASDLFSEIVSSLKI